MLVKSDANDWSRRMQTGGQVECNFAGTNISLIMVNDSVTGECLRYRLLVPFHPVCDKPVMLQNSVFFEHLFATSQRENKDVVETDRELPTDDCARSASDGLWRTRVDGRR